MESGKGGCGKRRLCGNSDGGLGADTTDHSVVGVHFSVRYASTASRAKGD